MRFLFIDRPGFGSPNSTIQAFAGLRDEMEVRLERAGAVVFAPGAGRLPMHFHWFFDRYPVAGG